MLRTHSRTVIRSDVRTDNVKTVYPPTNTVCSGYKNIEADQLPGYSMGDLCLFFTYAKSMFSHDAASIMYISF